MSSSGEEQKEEASMKDLSADYGDNVGREDDRSNKDHQAEDNPFACFGDDSSSEDINTDLVVQTATATRSMERSLHLVKKSNERMSAHQHEHVSQCVPVFSPTYEVFNSPGAGKGLKALKNFVRGEEIIRERAAMRIPNQQAATSLEEAEERHQAMVHWAFQSLESATREAFLALSSCCEDDADISVPVGIYQTNSYRLGDSEPYGGLFLTIARLNHSCRPNCHHIWRPDLKEMLVFATRDISVGEELCTTYGPSQCLSTAGRQAYLLDRFSFICQCEMCLENNHDGGDDRMLQLDALQENISLMAASGRPEAAIDAIEESLELLRMQQINNGAMLKPLFHHGYHIAMGRLGDQEMARSYLSKELIAVNQSEGVDSPKAMEIQDILDALQQ